MKNLKTLVVLFTITLFVFSCSDDDVKSPEKITQEKLVGTWTLSDFKENGSISTTIDGQTTEIDFSSVGSNYNGTIIYTENSSNLSASVSGTFVEITTEDGSDPEEEDVDLDDYMDEGDVSIGANTIASTSSIDVKTNIVQLDATTLKVSKDVNITNTVGHTETTITSKEVLTFTK